jgi:hypothetical protein
MLIFSTLKPEQLDLGRTSSEGLAGLKAFLEFAARGKSALPGGTFAQKNTDGAVELIARQIRDWGYTVDTGIGCSGYPVDMGIVHPDKPDSYLLGILCDSENYHNGGTALDRNGTQESVLVGLGWKLCRIWVLEWWANAEKELEKLKTAIKAALKEKTEPIAPPSAAPAVSAFEKLEASVAAEQLPQYNPAVLQAVEGHQGDTEYFASPQSNAILRKQLLAVLNAEAPISRELLARRVLAAWGISRAGSRINARFDELLSAMRVQYTETVETIYYWNDGQSFNSYAQFRTPTDNPASRRDMELIPPQELAAAIKYITERQLGLAREDLEREVSRIFGFARCTEAMQGHIKGGFAIAVKKGWVEQSGDRISVIK